jgi:integrase
MQYINGWSIYPCEGGYKGAKDNGKDAFGTRKRKTFRGASEKEVKLKIDKYEFDKATGQYVEPNKDTLVGFLETYYRLTKRNWEETTASLYRMYLDVHIKPYFKEMKLLDVKPVTLDEFYEFKMTEKRKYIRKADNAELERKPLSINTVIKLNKFFKAAFNYAVENDLLRKNPTNGVQLGKAIEYEPEVYDTEQFLKLYDNVYGKEEEIPIVLGAGCGLRRGEICGLRWKNIDFEHKTISIDKTQVRFNKNIEKAPKNKTSKRTISVPDYVIDALDRRLKKLGSVDENERIITKWKPGSLTDRFSNLLEEYGLPHTRLHDLRHYNATIMMRAGIPDKQAASRLGHSNVQTLRKTYQHILGDMDLEAAAKINSTMTVKDISSDKVVPLRVIAK